MGVLIPLYLAGLTALSLPLIFHLVRRTPRGRQLFSSLMFLAPTIPKLTRRSRLDQLLLLLLRLAALALIAFAFARPFFREASLLSLADLSGRRVALLIDTSASMRRGDLWQQALQRAEKELNELNPQDDVALYTFSDRLRPIIEFAKEDSSPIADKPQLVRGRLRSLHPDWNATELGTALAAVAGELDASTDVRQSALEPQIVVISDFQAGSRIEALRSLEWPKRVTVLPQPMTTPKTTNAYAQILPNEEGTELTDVRVRVVNAADSKSDQFVLSWVDPKATTAKPRETAVYVPAGQSRVMKLPRGTDDLAADRVLLRGDEHDFDNTFYVIPPLKQAASILYVGTDKADSPEGPQYFLRLAVANDPLRQVEVRSVDEKQPILTPADSPNLVVVSSALSPERQRSLTAYAERGGYVLLAPENREAAQGIPQLLDDIELAADSMPQESEQKYLLLGDIDFTHPLFVPFAGARYSDFTKIHFWRHFTLQLKPSAKTRVVARFDNGHPALLERLIGKGRILVLTSGWQPRDSQLALSSKFVPLVGALLDMVCGGTSVLAGTFINEAVTLPAAEGKSSIVVRSPDGQEHTLPAGEKTFMNTNQPGIYVAKAGSQETRFAVNLPAVESETAPLNLEQLEQSGVRIGTEQTRAERIERVRQQRDIELEGRQKIWRWLIAGALALLIFETWWAGRADRQLWAAALEQARNG